MIQDVVGCVTLDPDTGLNFRTRYYTESNIPIDVWKVPKDENYGCAKFYTTGSGSFNVFMRRVAVLRGMSLLFDGLTKDGILISDETEESVFAGLGIDFIEPAFRDPFDSRYDKLSEELDATGI